LVDNRWHELKDDIVKLRAVLDARAKRYADAKEEAERRARIEAQRVAAQEAARLKAEAEAAEQAMLAKAEPTMDDLDHAIATETAATKAEQTVAVAQKAAEAKPAELARTRTELGALGTLQEVWLFRDLERDNLDLALLRPHLSIACLEQAVRSYIKTGGRQCAGVTIYQDTALRVR
jgi:hypothetical protein